MSPDIPLTERNPTRDDPYFELLITPIKECAKYKPKLGKKESAGQTLDQFRRLYGSDPFYSWIGMDSALMYAAHKAAGGMTSIYRQVGIGGQWLLNKIIQDHLGLTAGQAAWSYELPKPDGKKRSLSLDARIELSFLTNSDNRSRIEAWMRAAAEKLALPATTQTMLKGAVFEIRQGYKSADSKRQNADIGNSANAYANLYLPVLTLLSRQISDVLMLRYSRERWLLLTGITEGDSTDSTYVFFRDVVGYDVAGFFERNSTRIRMELESILKTLLQA